MLYFIIYCLEDDIIEMYKLVNVPGIFSTILNLKKINSKVNF